MKRTVILISLILLTLLFSSCSILFDREPSPPIDIPEQVESVEIRLNTGGKNDDFSQEQIDTIIEIMNNATPTTNSSVNDSPGKNEYYVIILTGRLSNGQQGSNTIYLYRSFDYNRYCYSAWYLEQPYYGVYQLTNKNAQTLIGIANLE